MGEVNLFAVGLTALEMASLALIPYVMRRKREPVAATAWILCILLIPILGALLFLLFGLTRIERKKGRKREAALHLSDRLSYLLHPEVTELPESCYPVAAPLLQLARRLGEFPATRGNAVQLYTDATEAIRAQEDAIRQARHHIHVEYYIFQPDSTGQHYRDLLIEKARQGVRVRFLYDAIGSMRLGRNFLRPMRQAGIEVVCFLPMTPWRKRWGINLRSHRKILVVDGEVAFTGGANVGDEYVSKVRQFGYWRDTHMKLQGPCVRQIQHVFAQDWLFATEEELTSEELYPDPGFPGTTVAQVLPSGPDQEVQVLHELLLSAIAMARKEVLIESCYFVPPESILVALKAAAHRGVEVVLLLPGISAHNIPLLAAQSYYEELLESGVKIHIYRPGLLHSKIYLVDQEWALVGSPNLDHRSIRLNFEISVIFYDRPMIQVLHQAFLRDLQHSRPLEPDQWKQRPWPRRLLEDACRLASPVL
jgi:cardiolipin synthase